MLSTAASVAVYAAIGSAVLWAAQRTATQIEEEKEIAVKFKAPEPEPPKPKIPPPPAPPPVVPEGMKVKRTSTVRPPPSMVAPKQLSDKKLDEAKPGDAIEVAEGAGEVGGTGTAPAPPEPVKVAPPPPPPPPAPKHNEPINLPEDAEPAEPSEDNVVPEFPEAMRAAGKGCVVVLRIAISDKGTVGKIEVLKGEEPFIAAALAAVKTWTYTPAKVEGKAQAVFKVVSIPFRIKT